MCDILKITPNSAWQEPWKLASGGKTIFRGSGFLAYRQMFLNHVVHLRVQRGVYVRLNDKPLPLAYDPSANDNGIPSIDLAKDLVYSDLCYGSQHS